MTIPYVVRVAITAVIAVAALFVLAWLWRRYQSDPWTRDGRVRVDVVQVAPDVGGLVTEVDVSDNQPVRRGQRLFVIDRPRYELALAQAAAAVKSQAASLSQALREDRRNRSLGDLVAAETVEQGAARVAELKASLASARANLDVARLNLARTEVGAPLDGVVANLELQPGDYASAGRAVMALVASASLHVDGYFEETKLAAIHVGDPATVQLMGDTTRLQGHVQSLAPGIVDRERGESPNLLPNVNPTFSWVRLAQRIPVRIALDRVPPDVRLIAGRTATVTIHPRTKVRAP